MGDPVAILATEVSQFEGMRGACACLWPLELAISYFIKTSAKAKEIEGDVTSWKVRKEFEEGLPSLCIFLKCPHGH